MPPSRLQLELPLAQANDFRQFLLLHQKISSFQKTHNRFSISLTHQNQKEYLAFLKGIKEIYQLKNIKEIKPCQAQCRDNTPCLNKAKYHNYCWKHKKINQP